MLVQETKNKYFAVLADEQTKGRGSKGRTWISGASNLYLSVVIPLRMLPIPISLLPLRLLNMKYKICNTFFVHTLCQTSPTSRIGVIVSDVIRERVTSGADVNVKWPNDVLVGNKKV